MKTKNRKITLTLFIILILAYMPCIAFSAPIMPLSVDGFVYELDGYTQAPAGTFFSVYDISSGYYIEGRTGRGLNTGKYAVVVRGSANDLLNITASNGFNIVSRTATLSGVMHNVNLLLDTSIPNLPPEVVSDPVTAATEDLLYNYQVVASDPNGDNLTYSLFVNPWGMVISQDGLVSWTPTNDQVGFNDVTVEVSDGVFIDIQEFTIEVANVNDAPEIISGHITTATQDLPYSYDVEAVDVDGDELEFSLLESPDGMEINSSGYITWTPTKYQVGLNSVKVEVTDGELAVSQEFVIDVANVNDAPQITSSPLTLAVEDELYVYEVQAVDADGDAINYSLLEKPEGMAISGDGLISWTPTNDQVGFNNVTVEVSDGILSNVQAFEINVVNVNDAPEITSEPVKVAVAGLNYGYELEAFDIDSEELTYSLSGAPEGMTINETGFVSWEPKHKDSGICEITVEVYDGNIISEQVYNLTVFKIAKIDVFLDHAGNVSEVRVMLDFDRLYFDVQAVDKNTVIKEIVQRTNLTKPLVEELVKFHDKGQGGSPGSGGSNKKKDLETALNLIKDSDSITDMMVISLVKRNLNVRINKMLSKPRGIRHDLKKLVYEYLQIEREFNEDYIENYIKINFKVRKQWLDDNNIPPDGIVLSRYAETWEDLPTTFVEEKDGYAFYTSVTEGFSYFAITVSDKFLKKSMEEAVRNNKPLETVKWPGSITSFAVKTPFIISGIVYDKDGKTQLSSMPFSVKNLNTSEHFEGFTGEANQPGRFSVLMNGNLGDSILLEVGESHNKIYHILDLSDDLKNLQFILPSQKLGFVIQQKKEGTIIGIPLAMACSSLMIYFYIKIFRKKPQKPKKRIKLCMKNSKQNNKF